MFALIKFLHIPKKTPKIIQKIIPKIIKSKEQNHEVHKPIIFKTKIIHSLKKEKAKKNSSKFLGKKTLRFVVEKNKEFNTKKLEEIIEKKIKIKKLEENNVKNEGRWLEEEHDKFLDGIAQYGINWKKLKPFINSRTGNQIRSHAQKFYKRLKKCKDEQLGIDFTKDDISSIIDMIHQIKEVNSNYNIKEIFKHLSDNFDNRTKKFDFQKYENNLINNAINNNNNFLIKQNNEFNVLNNIPQSLNSNQIYNNDFPLNNNILFNNLFYYKSNLTNLPLINNLNNLCSISPNYNNYNNNEIAINNTLSNTNNPLFTSSDNKSIHLPDINDNNLTKDNLINELNINKMINLVLNNLNNNSNESNFNLNISNLNNNNSLYFLNPNNTFLCSNSLNSNHLIINNNIKNINDDNNKLTQENLNNIGSDNNNFNNNSEDIYININNNEEEENNIGSDNNNFNNNSEDIYIIINNNEEEENNLINGN